MKGIFKLIPAALAVFALASCSTDELEGSKIQEQTIVSKGDLRITCDPFDNDTPTRAMRNDNFGQLTFQDDDLVNVYDEGLYSVDFYKFQTDAFYYANTDEEMVAVPKYGVLPGDLVKKAYTDRPTRTTRVDIEIPHIIKYTAESEDAENALYACNLPAFGYANQNADDPDHKYVEIASLRYMVGILKIKLEKAVSNASWLKLTNKGFDGVEGTGDEKMLSGIFTAELFSDPAKRKDVKLQVLDETLPVHPELYVDLRAVPSNTSVIYIPVVPGLDGDLDNVTLEYTPNRTEDDPDLIPDADWVAIPGMTFASTEFKQHSRYSGEYAFEFADLCPKVVSDILAQYSENPADVNIDITKSFTIDGTDANISRFIKLPSFGGQNVNVNINLAESFATWKNTNPWRLEFTDADPENPFKGTVTLNIGTSLKAGKNERIAANLKEGTLVLAGDFQKFRADETIVLTSAGKVKIGNGTTTTSNVVWKAVGNDIKAIEIANNATVDVTGVGIDLTAAKNLTETVVVDGNFTGDIDAGPVTESVSVGSTGVQNGDIDGSDATTTITMAGTMTGDITYVAGGTQKEPSTVTVSGDLTGDIDGSVIVQPTVVNVSGSVSGGIDLTSAVWATVTLSGEKNTVGGNIIMPAAVKGSLDITTGKEDAVLTAVGGFVTTKGDVNIEMTHEGIAIAGQLTMLGANKTLTLKQGYVATVCSDVQNAGSWESKITKITFASGEGLTAFNKLALAKENQVIYGKSTWNGELITDATFKNKETEVVYNGATITTNAVFTACQLATLGTANTTVKLYNDFDLAGAGAGAAKWVGFDAESLTSFEIEKGAEKAKVRTIENLNLENAAAKGLVNTLSGTAMLVKDLTIKNVTGAKEADADGIGALAGANTGVGTIENVTVTGLALAPATGKCYTKVGGLIGNNSADVTLKTVKVVGSIDGYKELGGFIGATSANVTIDGGDAEGITFNQTFDSGKAMDINYAMVGGAIGTVTGDKNVTIDAASIAPASINFAKSSKMYVSNTSAEDGNFYTYTLNTTTPQLMVGYCGNQNHWSVGTVKIGGKTFEKRNFGQTDHEWVDGSGTRHYALYVWPKKN